jgi:hypothetical protein
MFTQPVNIGSSGKRGLDTQVLVFIDEWEPGSAEQDLVRRSTGDGELERLRSGGIVELELGVSRWDEGGFRSGEDVFWDFVAFVIGIGDLDVEAGRCTDTLSVSRSPRIDTNDHVQDS